MAEWLAYRTSPESMLDALQALSEARHCASCNLLYEEHECPLCNRPNSNDTRLLVIQEPASINSLLEAGYQGQFYLLHALLSPSNNVGPNDLRISGFLEQLTQASYQQIDLALLGSVEGQVTAEYLAKKIAALSLDCSVNLMTLDEYIQNGCQ